MFYLFFRIFVMLFGGTIGEPERQHPTPQGQRGIQIETDKQQSICFKLLTE